MNGVSKGPACASTFRRPALFYGSAREGFQDFLAHAKRRRGQDKVLLPAYIGWSPHEGSGVFDPVAALGLDFGFYGVREDLSADLDDIAQRAEGGEFGVLVVIHYFGRPEPRLDEMRAIAARSGMLLVEDLAHAFFGTWATGALGVAGDVQLYSLHKMFPIGRGGMVTYTSADLLSGQRSTEPELAAQILSFDWRSIAGRRRDAFTATAERLAALPEHGSLFTLLWPQLGDTDVPQSLPVRITGDNRDAIYRAMNVEGYGLVSLYHTLVQGVTNPVAIDLSRHIINLPCHQDLTLDQVPEMVEAFRRSLGAS